LRTLDTNNLANSFDKLALNNTIPGNISGESVYTNFETGAPYIHLRIVNTFIEYQVIDNKIFRFLNFITACDHTITTEIVEVTIDFIECNCEVGCLTDFKQVYIEYLREQNIKRLEPIEE